MYKFVFIFKYFSIHLHTIVVVNRWDYGWTVYIDLHDPTPTQILTWDSSQILYTLAAPKEGMPHATPHACRQQCLNLGRLGTDTRSDVYASAACVIYIRQMYCILANRPQTADCRPLAWTCLITCEKFTAIWYMMGRMQGADIVKSHRSSFGRDFG